MIKLFLPKFWYKRGIISWLLSPFSFIYRFFIAGYRFYYIKLAAAKFPVPIIVVGNITVGGTGKTPLVIYLANLLKERGYNPGIITRGYRRKNIADATFVTTKSTAEEVGDEALLIFHHVSSPIIVDRDRVAAARKLLEVYGCDVIVSDDGLQHYKLPRDIEIVLIDAEFGFGNKFCLPAGPLREPLGRLQQVDFVIRNFNTGWSQALLSGEYGMTLEPTVFRNVQDQTNIKTVNDFKDQPLHAVAGIGMPEKFFRTLRQLNLNIIEHPFPDHHLFCADDFSFTNEIIIMTEKDAVKCAKIARKNFWYLEVRVKVDEEFVDKLCT